MCIRDSIQTICLHISKEAALGINHQCQDAGLAQVGQQFVKLQNELLLLRHGGDVAAEAVDHEDLDGALLNFLDNVGGELARRNLRRVDLPNDKLPLIDARPKVEAHCFRARQKGVDALVELID